MKNVKERKDFNHVSTLYDIIWIFFVEIIFVWSYNEQIKNNLHLQLVQVSIFFFHTECKMLFGAEFFFYLVYFITQILCGLSCRLKRSEVSKVILESFISSSVHLWRDQQSPFPISFLGRGSGTFHDVQREARLLSVHRFTSDQPRMKATLSP